MSGKASRPRAGEPPKLTATLEILEELLVIERERLRTAREIEKRREMVFPETTVIVRDIERLLVEIERRKELPSPPGDGGAPAPAPSALGELERWE
jgi:hypothetical protein